MTIALRAAGTATTDPTAVTLINPAVPTGTTTGDIAILTVAAKPYSAVITTPAGWLKVTSTTNGTVASGTDTGSTLVAMYVNFSAAVGAIGNLTISGADSVSAVINSYTQTAGAWDITQSSVGGDTTNGANYSATGGTSLPAAVGDWVIGGTAVNGDVGTLSAITATVTGATLGTVVVRTNAPQSTGNDCRLLVVDCPVTGAGTGVPTFTYTNASSGSGSTVWLLLREVSAPAATATLVDMFDTDLTLWPGSYGTVSIVGGRARVVCDTGYAELRTWPAYTLVGSSLTAQVFPPALGGATGTAAVTMRVISPVAGTEITMYVERLSGSLVCQASPSGNSDPNQVSVTYDPVQHAWFRLRESAGTLYWETSPDGTTWTNQRTTNAATPSWVTANAGSSIGFFAHRDSGTNDYTEVDNVNALPAQWVLLTPTPRYR